jgi:hypothetical protein
MTDRTRGGAGAAPSGPRASVLIPTWATPPSSAARSTASSALPARMATLAAAGLPMIQRANRGSIVAAQSLAERLRTGIFFESPADLGEQLRNEVRTASVRSRVVDGREVFTFGAHADRLVEFFRRVIDRRPGPAVPAIRTLGGRRRRRDTSLQGAPAGGAGSRVEGWE